MSPDLLLLIGSASVAPFWCAMILGPRSPLTRRLVASVAIALPPCVLYTLVILPQMHLAWPSVLTPSNATINAWFNTEYGTFVPTAHFLGVDLFVGRWMFFDAWKRGLSPGATRAMLALCMLLTPIALPIYLLLRAYAKPSLERTEDEDDAAPEAAA